MCVYHTTFNKLDLVSGEFHPCGAGSFLKPWLRHHLAGISWSFFKLGNFKTVSDLSYSVCKVAAIYLGCT